MKKQLCLLAAVLLSMSVLGGYRAFAEAYTQRVSLCDFQPDIKTLLYDDDFKDIGGASLGKISYLVGDGDIVVGGISLTKDEKPYSMIMTDTGEVKTNIKTIKKTDATSDPMAFTAIYDGGKLTENEFKTNLIKMIKDVKSAGANVIVGSSTFTAWGVTDKTFTPNSGNYYSLAIQAAKENNVPCIDLHTAMQNDLKALCSDSFKTYKDALNEYYLTAELFAAEDPGGTRYYKNPSVAKSGYDVTHLSYKGAKRLCEVIIKNLLKQSSSTLKTYLK